MTYTYIAVFKVHQEKFTVNDLKELLLVLVELMKKHGAIDLLYLLDWQS